MKISMQKKFWWSAFLVAFGGTAALIALVLNTLLTRDQWYSSDIPTWCIWPPICAVSGILLRRCYKKEPMAPLGFWHLNLHDLLAASLYVGGLLAAMKSLIPKYFLSAGVPFAIISGIAFVIGLLSAARAGLRRKKFFYALSCGLRLVGLFSLGAAGAVVVMDGLMYRVPFEWIKMVLFGPPSYFSHDEFWALILHRLTLGCLPLGLICFEIAKRNAHPELEAAPPPESLIEAETVTPATARR